MPKFFIYKKTGQAFYEPDKMVYADVRDGSVLQPEFVSGSPDPFGDPRDYLVKEYPTKGIIPIKQTNGEPYRHLYYTMDALDYTEEQIKRIEDAIEEYDLNKYACLEKYYPFKEQPTYALVDPRTWRAAAYGTVSFSPTFTSACTETPDDEKREKPTPMPTGLRIAERHEWPACCITEEKAEKSGARHLNGNRLRSDFMFPGPDTFKIA